MLLPLLLLILGCDLMWFLWILMTATGRKQWAGYVSQAVCAHGQGCAAVRNYHASSNLPSCYGCTRQACCKAPHPPTPAQFVCSARWQKLLISWLGGTFLNVARLPKVTTGGVTQSKLPLENKRSSDLILHLMVLLRTPGLWEMCMFHWAGSAIRWAAASLNDIQRRVQGRPLLPLNHLSPYHFFPSFIYPAEWTINLKECTF